VAMTLLGSIPSNNANNGYLYFFGIANQASGAKTVSFTFSGTTDHVVGASLSFTGAGLAVATAFGAMQPVVPSSGTGYGSAANPALSPASSASGSVACVIASAATAITSMSGGSQKFLDANTGTGACSSIVGSTATGVGAGGTINFTSSITAAAYAIGAVTIQAIQTAYGVGTPGLEDTMAGKITTTGQAINRASQW
jgi:hypothetical protein